MIKVDVILKYDPKPLTGDATKMLKSWWLIAFVEGEVSEYYAWFLKKQTGIILQKPAWGSHVSVVRGEEPVNKDLWKKYDNEVITIEYDPDVRTNSDHWWLRVTSERMFDIREELGLIRKHELSLHLTLGRPIPRHEVVSEYFHKVYSFV